MLQPLHTNISIILEYNYLNCKEIKFFVLFQYYLLTWSYHLYALFGLWIRFPRHLKLLSLTLSTIFISPFPCVHIFKNIKIISYIAHTFITERKRFEGYYLQLCFAVPTADIKKSFDKNVICLKTILRIFHFQWW